MLNFNNKFIYYPLKEIYKSIVSYLFCDYKEHEAACNKAWNSKSELPLFIKPKNYNYLERIIGRAPYGRLCNIADDEFSWYGHANSILNYANYTNYPIRRVTAEHGMITSNNISSAIFEGYKNKLVLTYGEHRASLLRNVYNINSESIGPYIHYAKLPIEISRLLEIKNFLKRVVVHFPLFGNANNFDVQAQKYSHEDHKISANTLLKWKNSGLIDNIIVCYRWSDYGNLRKEVDFYRNIGAIDACCGSILNPFFLNQLRLIIELSYCTTSNAITTPLGYSSYMNKPHFIIGMPDANQAEYKQTDPISNFLFENLYATAMKTSIDMPAEDVYLKIANLFGFNCVKMPNELKNLCLNQERNFY